MYLTAYLFGALVVLPGLFLHTRQAWVIEPAVRLAKETNNGLNLDSPISVVVGGTNGIGAGMAVKLAQYSTSPTIHIVGRNVTAAKAVISNLELVNPQGTYQFHQRDVSHFSEVRSLISSLGADLPYLSHLILTAGLFTNRGRTEVSPEQPHDTKLVLHHYSRFLLTRDLLPLMQAATHKWPGMKNSKPQVISVLDSRGNMRGIEWDDLDLKNEYSMSLARTHAIAMTDATHHRWAAENPGITFSHAYPGFVVSSLYERNNLPSWLEAPARLLVRTLGVPTLDCAEILLAAMHRQSPPGEHGKQRFIDSDGKRVRPSMKKLATDEEVEKLWAHSVDIIG